MRAQVGVIHVRPYTKQWLQELCADSFSYAEVLKKAGRKQTGGNQETLKRKISEFEIDISHFTGQRWYDTPYKVCNLTGMEQEKYTLEEVLCKDSPVKQKTLRGYIERHRVLEYKCVNCGCDGHWQGGMISLEIDHVDGDCTNNELSNLRYLCPNCHALTETYRGRNKALKN